MPRGSPFPLCRHALVATTHYSARCLRLTPCMPCAARRCIHAATSSARARGGRSGRAGARRSRPPQPCSRAPACSPRRASTLGCISCLHWQQQQPGGAGAIACVCGLPLRPAPRAGFGTGTSSRARALSPDQPQRLPARSPRRWRRCCPATPTGRWPSWTRQRGRSWRWCRPAPRLRRQALSRRPGWRGPRGRGLRRRRALAHPAWVKGRASSDCQGGGGGGGGPAHQLSPWCCAAGGGGWGGV
jgi:hypothetical protein